MDGVRKPFWDEEDYKQFTELLKEISEMWNVRIAAYCLMPNHYHMLVQTPEANISMLMAIDNYLHRLQIQQISKLINVQNADIQN